MEVDDGNLMDALMKAVAKGRPGRVEWSGMEIAAITTSTVQRSLIPDLPQRIETDVDIVQVDVGDGATQLSWSGLEVATTAMPTRVFHASRKSKEQVKSKITEVEVKGGGVQLAFL